MMILRYLFICVFIVAVILGFRQFSKTTKDMIAYNKEASSIYRHIYKSQIKELKKEKVKFGATNNSIVTLAILDDKKIAIENLESEEQNILIRRTPDMDKTFEQIFAEPVDSFEFVGNVFLHFLFRFFGAVFLFAFGGLFATVSYVLKKNGKKIKNYPEPTEGSG